MRDFSGDRRWLAINTATLKSWSLEQVIAGCSRAGITAIAPWRDIVQQCGVQRAGKLIRESGLTVTCLCRGGMFTAADEAGRRAALDDNRRAVDALEKAVSFGVSPEMLRDTPNFDSLKDNPRFVGLIQSHSGNHGG